MGNIPAIIAACHQHGTQALSRSRSSGRNRVGPVPAILLSESHQQNRIRHGDTDGHDRAHEAFEVQRGLCDQEHQDRSDEDSRNAGDNNQRQAERLKICRKQKENDNHGKSQTDSQLGKDLLQRIYLRANLGGRSQAQALFETSVELPTGLEKAFINYKQRAKPVWKGAA
jgi:hypothetical protein